MIVGLSRLREVAGISQESQYLVVPKVEKSEAKRAKAEIPSAKIFAIDDEILFVGQKKP